MTLTEIHYEIGREGNPMPSTFDPPDHVVLGRGLPQIQFEPGWTFWWDQGRRFLHWNVQVRPPALKAFDSVTGNPRPISWRYVVETPSWEKCWDRIRGIEFHLAGEWFSVNGEKLMHPHKKNTLYPFRTPA